MPFAVNTSVPVDRTRSEIERLVVTTHKCKRYSSGMDFEHGSAMIQFETHDRVVRFVLPLPNPSDKAFRKPSRGHYYDLPSDSAIVVERVRQAERTLWRAFLLVIKAKLEAVESKIATFEQEFMANIVMPNDRTIEEIVTPLIARAYETRQMPQGLLMLPERTGD